MVKVAIVILNWNGVKMLKRFLPCVLECSQGDAVVYVADNASTDDSVGLLKTEFPETRLILLDKNYGFADGYNRALRQIEAEYYVLLNSDVEVTRDWIRILTDFMDSHPDVAACQPKLLAENNRKAFEYAGACGGFIDRFGYPFCRGRILDTVENDEGQYDEVNEIHWATGACMMIRASDYWKAGGLDARFFAHNEEIDLCWRLRIMGRKIYCVPGSRVFHVGGGTLPKGNPMKTFLNFRNNLTMLYKNLPDKELRRVMSVRLFLDYVAALQTLIKGNVGDFRAILRGRMAFRKWKHEYGDMRRKIQDSRLNGNKKETYNHSIIWQYYARGRKKFSQLKNN
ncbi:MAG: glycosyltransferase family 2 protein [Prevotella sp.]|nr:glycosyltransferase family 2 protein [Prevotella sp.]